MQSVSLTMSLSEFQTFVGLSFKRLLVYKLQLIFSQHCAISLFFWVVVRSVCIQSSFDVFD